MNLEEIKKIMSGTSKEIEDLFIDAWESRAKWLKGEVGSERSERKFIIEVMGRNTGFLAVEVGIAGGAEFIITPEFPVTTDELITKMTKQNRKKLTSFFLKPCKTMF